MADAPSIPSSKAEVIDNALRRGNSSVTSPAEIPQPAIRIVIAEDQALVRRGAALLLSMESDMEVVGQACNGVEAVELTQLSC